MTGPAARPAAASLVAVLAVTALTSVSAGCFWAGIFFVTAQQYAFSAARNLALAAVMGGVYAVAASLAGPGLRALEKQVSTRLALSGTLCLWGAAALMPLLAPTSQTVMWCAALVGGAASAAAFPIIESYLTSGRHGADMRNAIGWFNITWTPATALPLVVMPLLPPGHILWTLAFSVLANALACAALLALPPNPAPHGAPLTREHPAMQAEYPLLLRAASWLLPLSYVICSSIGPVLPHRLAAIGVPPPGTLIAAIWMMSRFAGLFLMWRSEAWHGRWATLLFAFLALLVGGVAILLGRGMPVVVGGLCLLGAGMALTYYSAIYYAMAVGQGAVDAGGAFEARIGIGYAVGPLVGVIAHVLFPPSRAEWTTVWITWLIAMMVLVPALRPYLIARRRRR